MRVSLLTVEQANKTITNKPGNHWANYIGRMATALRVRDKRDLFIVMKTNKQTTTIKPKKDSPASQPELLEISSDSSQGGNLMSTSLNACNFVPIRD